MKYRTNELVEQLLIRGKAPDSGGYAYATGYLCSFIEMLPSNVKLTAKQDKALREVIENCIAGLIVRNMGK